MKTPYSIQLSPNNRIKFVGLDTETQDGRAVLVATPNAYKLFPRSFAEIVYLLATERAPLVCYNMDYDARAILTFLPQYHLCELAHFGSTKYRDMVSGREFSISYLSHKLLKITTPGLHKVEIYDCWQYYHTSLDVAGKTFSVDLQKIKVPKTWLVKMRSVLEDGRYQQRAIEYCQRDALVCERLFNALAKQFSALGIGFDKPLSTGSVVFAHYRKRLTSPLIEEQNNRYQEIYFGGRMETFQRGYFATPTIYDLNSAYPAAIAKLPDPRTLFLRRGRTFNENCTFGLYDISANITERFIAPMALRSKGDGGDESLIYPTGTMRARVDKWTMQALMEIDAVERLHYAEEWFAESDDLWFPEIAELYEERKARPDIALAIKLVLNSLYGKLAERRHLKRVLDRRPSADSLFFAGKFYRPLRACTPHTNFLAAAHVTGYVRKQLYDAIRSIDPEKVIYANTDSIITTEAIAGLDEGTGLGQWKVEARPDGLIVIGTGVYAYHTDNGWVNRFRGFHSRVNLVDVLRSKQRKTVVVPTTNSVSLLQAVEQKRLHELNKIEPVKRILNVNFDHKRHWSNSFQRAEDVLSTSHTSMPFIAG